MRAPTRVGDGVGDCGGGRRVRRLADALDVYGPTPSPGAQHDGLERRDVGNGRDLVVAERERGDAPVFEQQLLHERVADALDEAAVDLPLVADGVDDLARVVRRREVEQLDLARLRVDRDLGDLHREAGHLGAPLLVGVPDAADGLAGSATAARSSESPLPGRCD